MLDEAVLVELGPEVENADDRDRFAHEVRKMLLALERNWVLRQMRLHRGDVEALRQLATRRGELERSVGIL